MRTAENPLISVIVPIYNAEKNLRRCIESIITQAYPEIELLLVNDGSTDQSGKICNEYSRKDNRIQVLHKKNGGVSAARNDGLRLAKGEWIAFVDSDDWIEKDYLHNLIKYKEFPFIVGGYKSFGAKEIEIMPEYTEEIHVREDLYTLFKQTIRKFVFWFVWGKLFRRNIIEENHISFLENMKYSEDNCFVLDYLGCVDKFIYLATAGYMHKQERNRAQKYSMDYECFMQHLHLQDSCISQLENKINCRLVEVRQNVHRRILASFVHHLLNSPNAMAYHSEIKKFKEFDKSASLLTEVSITVKSKIKHLVLFSLPWVISFACRKSLLRLMH